MDTRATLRAAVSAIGAGHNLRMEAFILLEQVLRQYGDVMSREVFDAYALQLLRLTDPAFYDMPWPLVFPR
ncbi:MAG: hypothetical protein HY905_15705 [Deltaproteobacteria bacterium]|nr:hypothetical protein [Deltaproteobacteria bacterium]